MDSSVGAQHCGCASALEPELDTSQKNFMVGKLHINKTYFKKKVHEMNCCETAIAHTLDHKLYRVMHFYWSFLSTEPSIEVILTDILITGY